MNAKLVLSVGENGTKVIAKDRDKEIDLSGLFLFDMTMKHTLAENAETVLIADCRVKMQTK